jgi:hypothetical protein
MYDDDDDNPDSVLNRMIRVETRLARLQKHMGMRTRITDRELEGSPFNDHADLDYRAKRIETRIYRMLESLNLNPYTGAPL